MTPGLLGRLPDPEPNRPVLMLTPRGYIPPTPPPPAVDHLGLVRAYNDLGNKRFGDCVIAAIGHMCEVDYVAAGLPDPGITVRAALELYKRVNPDFDGIPGGPGDRGCVTQVALDRLMRYGISTRFAARHPDGLRLLVLHHPLMVPDDRWEDWVAERRALIRQNVDGVADNFLAQIAPSRAMDASFRDWYARAGRVGASPTTATRIWESVFNSRPSEQLFEWVQTPTLVLYRRESAYAPADGVRLAASHIPGATVVELEGADHFPFLGDVDAVLAEIADFVLGERRLPPPQRILAALMFTDLVASTEHAASLGDSQWKSVLDRHDRTVRAAVGGCGGTVVKTTGDGVLALLPSAGAAIRAAQRVRDALATDGLAVRIGIHVGDIDRRGDDISGVGVHIAARAMASADAGEIVVTASVPTSVTGEATTFETLGAHELKGVPGTWELFRLANNQASTA